MTDNPKPIASAVEHMLARAFDLAWTRFLALEGEAVNTAENRGSLAARIVVLAKLGETDETAISEAASLYLRALVAARHLVHTPRQGDQIPAAPSGPVLDPEAIAAASLAFEACLDELPEGISAAARTNLFQSILERAGHGEHDSDRLRLMALETLRSRR